MEGAFNAARLAAYFLTSFCFLASLASWDFLAMSKNKAPEERTRTVSPCVYRVKRLHASTNPIALVFPFLYSIPVPVGRQPYFG